MPQAANLRASSDEQLAWAFARSDKLIKARELAQEVIEKNKSSYVAHLVLGYVEHYAEANIPRSVFHLEKALKLYERKYGKVPTPQKPWGWHSRILKELGASYYDMEEYEKRIAFMDRYNEYYRPLMIAERAWPLMKLRRYKEARKYAKLALKEDTLFQKVLAYNALCAIEFEAGDNEAGYLACKQAVEHARQERRTLSAVDLSNYAEASRSLFKLDEAEKTSLEATRVPVSWYANPWLDLADLYLREGRFAESLSAFKSIAPYRAERPPHVRNVDLSELRRGLAAFFLVMGKADVSAEISEKALLLPDRRAHTSREAEQDRAILALLHRRALRVSAEQQLEKSVDKVFYKRLWAWMQASFQRMKAWRAGQQVARLLSEGSRLAGTFKIGSAQSAVMPPWFAGDLIDVLGPSVSMEALREAEQSDERPLVQAYYDAFKAETFLRAGRYIESLRAANAAEKTLGKAEVLLRARLFVVAAEASWQIGQAKQSAMWVDRALQHDPGAFRRLEIPIPTRFPTAANALEARVLKFLARSDRLDKQDRAAIRLQFLQNTASMRLCLIGASGDALGCAQHKIKHRKEDAANIAKAFHEQVFAPNVDLTQVDINSLEGSNIRSPDALRSLFNEEPAASGNPSF
ncbi:MAG: hypothetical protein IPJ88_17220 [Myxococcales bacterium]|nr:MAG: hypothetical protein IPJ88_17220 [Myxococcales bacterium]